MIEVRFHGRGGQGAVTACNILASALLRDGKWAQSFPLFGGERRGAPVMAFLRISDTPVMARGHVYQPDHVVVLDARLLPSPDSPTLAGLKKDGWVLVNTGADPAELKLTEFRGATVDASGIAASHHLGSAQARPVNTAILGAFARVTRLVTLDSVVDAIGEEAPAKAAENMDAAREAYERVRF